MLANPPFFILANPRSGSSLLRIICTSNRHILVPPECGFLEWWYPKYKDWNQHDVYDTEQLDTFCSDLESSKKFETWDFDMAAFKKLVLSEIPNTYSELIALVYESFGQDRDKDIQIWGDKNNYYIHKTELLGSLYPTAKFIHLVRDGRDVATSYIALKDANFESKYAPKLTVEIEEIATEWQSNNLELLTFFETLPSENILRVHFEDLLTNLENESKRICKFLEVDFDEEMLTYYLQNSKKKLEPSDTLEWKKKTLEKPDVASIGKYRHLLSEAQINTFNKTAAKALKEFNYGI